MSPEFVCVYSQATAAEALEQIRTSRASAEALAWVYAMDTHKRCSGAIVLVDLLRAAPYARLAEIAATPQRLRPEAGLEEVARLMTDYDLTVAPVVDEQERMLGVITVDDVLELVLPRGWRRRFGLFGES
jgi:Mg/Co/Ni transporter MgtE